MAHGSLCTGHILQHSCPLPSSHPSHSCISSLWVIIEHQAELPVLYGTFPVGIYTITQASIQEKVELLCQEPS